MRIRSFRFNLQELGGALGDLGTLLPLMIALILVNGLNATLVLGGVGLLYIISGLYFRIPISVQPLKAVSLIAISLGLSATVIGAAGLLMGVILIVLSMTNLIDRVVKLFPREVVRGIQLSIGLLLLKKGIDFALGEEIFAGGVTVSSELSRVPPGILIALAGATVFVLFKFVIFRHSRRIPASLALLVFGIGTGLAFGTIPGFTFADYGFAGFTLPAANDYWLALTALVIPQLPLTLGNAVVGTRDTARAYFGEASRRVTPRALTCSMGLANIVAGALGAMPMCHGSGGVTAHYQLGARTGGSNLMIGGLILMLALVLGGAALPVLSLIPLAVLGVLLMIVGIYHAFLVSDLRTVGQLAVAATVALVTLIWGNLALGFGTGTLVYYALRIFWRTPLSWDLGWQSVNSRINVVNRQTGMTPAVLLPVGAHRGRSAGAEGSDGERHDRAEGRL